MKLKRRQNVGTPKWGQNTVADIIDAINEMKKADALPPIAVSFSSLDRLPLSRPAETSNVSICDRLSRIEARLAVYEDANAAQACSISQLEHRARSDSIASTHPASAVNALQSDMSQLGATSQNHDLNLPRPNFADIIKAVSQSSDGFKDVKSKRHRRNEKPPSKEAKDDTKGIRGRREGAAQSQSCLKAGSSKFMMQLTNLHPDVTDQQLKDHIRTTSNNTINDVVIENKTDDGWPTQRFVLTVPGEAEETVMDPAFWPPKIYLSKWFAQKSKPKESQAAKLLSQS